VIVSLADLEAAARERLPAMAYDYYAGGAHDEITLRENRSAYDRIALRPRVLVDVSKRDTSVSVLGHPLAAPVLVAPMALQRMAHPDGELATARAAAAAKSLMVVSTLATSTLEEVAAAAAAPRWFQLYIYQDRGATRALVERVEAAGYRALMLTVDTPFLGRRERDIRNGFSLPEGMVMANLISEGMEEMVRVHAGSSLAAHTGMVLDPALGWRDIAWLRSVTRLPIVLKGILRGDDARRAVGEGVAAIVVSNHGGRQLDTAVASIRALPDVVAAVAGGAEVLVDGGVRRGTDILKALALGARAVCVGRPVLWGLAIDGEAGVVRVLEQLREELDLAMALAGCRTIAEITPDLLA
jgi:4-hydroxymandelate oxidase